MPFGTDAIRCIRRAIPSRTGGLSGHAMLLFVAEKGVCWNDAKPCLSTTKVGRGLERSKTHYTQRRGLDAATQEPIIDAALSRRSGGVSVQPLRPWPLSMAFPQTTHGPSGRTRVFALMHSSISPTISPIHGIPPIHEILEE
jgi:hypothetical protein